MDATEVNPQRLLLAFQLNAILMLGSVFFPLIGREAGLGLSEIGFVRAIHSLVNAVARPLSSPFVERLGGVVVGLSFLVELDFLKGRDKLPGYDIHTVIRL